MATWIEKKKDLIKGYIPGLLVELCLLRKLKWGNGKIKNSDLLAYTAFVQDCHKLIRLTKQYGMPPFEYQALLSQIKNIYTEYARVLSAYLAAAQNVEQPLTDCIVLFLNMTSSLLESDLLNNMQKRNLQDVKAALLNNRKILDFIGNSSGISAGELSTEKKIRMKLYVVKLLISYAESCASLSCDEEDRFKQEAEKIVSACLSNYCFKKNLECKFGEMEIVDMSKAEMLAAVKEMEDLVDQRGVDNGELYVPGEEYEVEDGESQKQQEAEMELAYNLAILKRYTNMEVNDEGDQVKDIVGELYALRDYIRGTAYNGRNSYHQDKGLFEAQGRGSLSVNDRIKNIKDILAQYKQFKKDNNLQDKSYQGLWRGEITCCLRVTATSLKIELINSLSELIKVAVTEEDKKRIDTIISETIKPSDLVNDYVGGNYPFELLGRMWGIFWAGSGTCRQVSTLQEQFRATMTVRT